MQTRIITSRRSHAEAVILGLAIALLIALVHGTAYAQAVPRVPVRTAPPPTTTPPPSLTSPPGLITLAELHKRAAWRAALQKSPLPKKGCYRVSYPNSIWQRVPCSAAPRIPYRPYKGHASGKGYVVGNGPLLDFSAQLLGDTITGAGGSLYDVSSGIQETGVSMQTGLPASNVYSLQLNTNSFNTPLCAGSKPGPNSPCQGWQQFIYANHGAQAQLFIQYWLIAYNATCPSGWMTSTSTLSGSMGTEIDCFKNDDADDNGATLVPVLAVSQLPNAILTGSAGKSSDGAILIIGTDGYAVSSDDPLAVEQGWREVEFNIFGDGDGTQANFAANTTINVRTYASGARMMPVGCDQKSFTGETNNLSLSGVPQVSPPHSDYSWITFAETDGAAMPAGCNTYGGTGFTLELVPGDKFVDWAKDRTGWNAYLSSNGAAMCVVHAPSCGTVGHNGKDHFFPKDRPLPPGVKLIDALYKAYWPPNLNRTDRGGLGSQGSYGDDADGSIQAKAPLFSVHWQNACQANPNGNSWRGLNNTYQVSFLISVPNGVNVDGAVPINYVSGPMCAKNDQPGPGTIASSNTGSVSDDPVYLTKVNVYSGPLPWEATFPAPGLERTPNWSFLKITNTNPFPVFLVNNTHSSSDCFQSGAGVRLDSWDPSLQSTTDYTTDIQGFLDPGSNQSLDLIVCTETGASVPAQVALSVEHTY